MNKSQSPHQNPYHLLCSTALVFVLVLLAISACSPVEAMHESPTLVVPSAVSTPSPTCTPAPTLPSPTSTSSPTTTLTPAPTGTATLTPTATAIPMPTPDGVSRELLVPILMYHYVSAPPADADAVRIDLSTTPTGFEDQLAALKTAGYTTISLHDLVFALQTGSSLPDKPVILTFDDGYRDNYENAFPILQAHDMTGTFFVITGFLDDERPEYLSWDQVTEMAEAGMSIESHSYDHPDLRNRDIDHLVWQILGPKQAIEERTGVPVRFFCYPSGAYDDTVMQVLASADYWGATTVNQGIVQSSESPFELSRIRVRGSYTGQDLLDVIDDYMESAE